VNPTNLARFLLAQLHLDSLVGMRSPKAIRTALGKLATGNNAYDIAYKDAIERIEGQVKHQYELAKQVLSWITCAKRPLYISELQHALAVEVGEAELDEENLPQIEDMISVCAGLVTIDEESNIIRLVHYTTQEYFERTWISWFPHAQIEITTICVTYLSFNTFKSSYCRTDSEFEERLQSNKLYDYAAHNWGHHAREASTSCQGVIEFLEKQGHVEASSQALIALKEWSGHTEYSQEIPKQMTGLHLAAYLGVDDVVRDLLGSNSPDPKDSHGRTPLWWAASNGYEAVVKLLLEIDKVDINIKDKDGKTPLLRAVENRHKAVVKLLLNSAHVDINAKSKDGETPLLSAASRGHETIVKLLLDSGQVDINVKDIDSQTPLLRAASNGYEAIVKLLLNSNQVDIDAKDKSGQTPLSRAALRGHEAVVKLLLTIGIVNVDTKDKKGPDAAIMGCLGRVRG